MLKSMIVYLTVFIILQNGLSSILIENSEKEVEENKKINENKNKIIYQKTEKSEVPKLELVIDVKNLPHTKMVRNRKNRKGDKLKRRKHGKLNGRQKNKMKLQNVDIEAKNILRNNEKVDLVRNRTIEILKSGVRILNTGSEVTDRPITKVNETLLEKILSSASVSKPDMLISASGIYKLPIGGDVYTSKKLSKPDHEDYIKILNRSEVLAADEFMNKTENKEMKDYEYDYDEIRDWDLKKGSEYLDNRSLEKSALDYESIHIDYNIGTTIEQLVNILQNLTKDDNNCSNCDNLQEVDPCERWIRCKDNLESAFLGDDTVLPSCPCIYPSAIFYDDKIWDEKNSRFYRWRDSSGESERLDVYKPGANYCIRSLLAQGSQSVAAQHCCYDRDLHLLTRGSGAGNINFVSPDVSKRLHDTVDILPWRLCKGDFTRYNTARRPDNGNNCPVNPDNEEYQRQVEYSKYF